MRNRSYVWVKYFKPVRPVWVCDRQLPLAGRGATLVTQSVSPRFRMLRRVSNAAKTAHVFQSMRTFTAELPGATMPRLDSFRGIDPNLTVGKRGSSDFHISTERDRFDLSFNNYSKFQATAGPDYVDHVPDILHHISLGTAPQCMAYQRNRQSCLDLHPGWETHLWTDENAGAFVAEKFPELEAMWDSYRYAVQKAEALKYLVLYEYGAQPALF
ncbi:hypothetical protein Purlil1_13031 [Purpureocillium lilacinum]|uniref:Uncharacterized protein n=1 Tax=Purpureocillium lilacinum TaxID=33203 RepID=A0ABR0BF65_PURLI|nr:hypothetical protein Purlil1_13031 [Purpureocillium lilacinum]